MYGGTLMDRSNLVKPKPPPRGIRWVPPKRGPNTPSFEKFLGKVSEEQRRKAAKLAQAPDDGFGTKTTVKFGEAEREAFLERQAKISEEHKETMEALHKEAQKRIFEGSPWAAKLHANRPASAGFMKRNNPAASFERRAKAVEQAKAKMLKHDPLLNKILQ
jgi:hypothetical protein